jgi:hexokinase
VSVLDDMCDIMSDAEVVFDTFKERGSLLMSSGWAPCLQIEQSTQEERELVVDLIEIVVERGARLAGAGIVGVLKKIGRDGSSVRFGSQQKLNARLTAGAPTVVGVDGGLFEHYAFFRNTMQGAIGQLLGDNAKLVSLELTKDGSGIGAALLAATYSKYKQK